MFKHGIPWQSILGSALMRISVFVAVMLLSLISGYFSLSSTLLGLFLATGFYIIVFLLPLLLSLSRTFFGAVFILLIIHIVTTLFSFALYFQGTGILEHGLEITPSFHDALYFSITTFTTLGYGDLQPLPDHRLTTSLEALFGMISMAIGASMIWMWCQENMLPKEMAFFDGNRRHKKGTAVARLRVRTITGKERELKDWIPAPEEGSAYHYDPKKQEWFAVKPETEITGDALVIGAKNKSE